MRKYFVTGLLILVPIAITLWVLNLVIGTMDQSLLLLPEKWRPGALIGFHVPGAGAVLTLLFILVVGLLLIFRDAVLELVPRLDVGVPQGPGRFDAEASDETAEKNRNGRN
jgi:uncharacterized membrane protein